MFQLPSIVFEATTDCNLDCRYCYNIWKNPGVAAKRHNSYRGAKKTLHRLFKIADVKQVTMSGGEPLLAERFSELVLFCRMKHKTVSVITNGNVADARTYGTLHDLGVALFELPLHSDTAELHDAMTGRGGSFERTVQSIETLKRLGAEVVVAVVVTKINAAVAPLAIKFAHQLGVRRVMVNRFNIGGRGIAESEKLWISGEELHDIFHRIDEVARQIDVEVSSNVCVPTCLLDTKKLRNIRFSHCSASHERRPVTIDARGDVRMCNHSPVVIGNLFDTDLRTMFESEKSTNWTTVIPDVCSECHHFPRCRGGCRAAAEQLGAGLDTVDPVVTGLANFPS